YHYNIKNATWAEISFFKNHVVNEFFQKGDTIVAVFKKDGDSLAISVDNGLSWGSKLMPSSSYYSSFQKSDNVLFTSIYDSSPKFYISLDYGSNWTSSVTGLTNGGLRDIQIFKGYIYACAPENGGLYRRELSQLSGIIYNGQGKLEAINIKNATYQWFLNGVSIPSANQRTLQGYANGKYKVEIAVQDNSARVDGSQVISYEFVVTDLLTTGLDNPTKEFPLASVTYDPSTQSIRVNTIESSNVAQVEVFNMLGQRLVQRSFEEQDTTFKISHLPLGPCIVRLNLDGKMQAYKVYIY
ncbi:MAG TPA: T9SS type A sorting domain-containing protein, partial [Cytophagaceae bacterium]